jgi:hypothetical protein
VGFTYIIGEVELKGREPAAEWLALTTEIRHTPVSFLVKCAYYTVVLQILEKKASALGVYKDPKTGVVVVRER